MHTITLNAETKAALLWCVETSIDMLNDMALDPMWFNPQTLRELAGKSDEEIRATLTANGKEADKNVTQLLNLELLRLQLREQLLTVAQGHATMIPTSTTTGNKNMKYDMKELTDLHLDYDGETTFGNYTIKVEQDSMAESPREWDNLGTMVCWHRNYDLGDVDGQKEYSDPDMFWYDLAGIEDTDSSLDKAIEQARKKNIILPLYLYDHSGITMSTSSFSCQWDSGQVGYIYISLEQVRKEYSCKRVSAKLRKRVEKYLTGEVETYDNFLTGNVYGFTIEREDADGEDIDVDSCWGFFGYQNGYMDEDIKANIIADIARTPQQAELF